MDFLALAIASTPALAQESKPLATEIGEAVTSTAEEFRKKHKDKTKYMTTVLLKRLAIQDSN